MQQVLLYRDREKSHRREERTGGSSVPCLVPSTDQYISHMNARLSHFCLVSASFLGFLFCISLFKCLFVWRIGHAITLPYITVYTNGNYTLYFKRFAFFHFIFSNTLFCHLLSLPVYSPRMPLKCWLRAMNSTRLRVHAWPSGELRLY